MASTSSAQGDNLLKLLLREPTTISPQKQREKETRGLQTLGLREQPPVHGSWNTSSSSSSFSYHYLQQFPNGTIYQTTRQIPYHYYYTDSVFIPWHHLFNTSVRYDGYRYDPDEYLPQCDLHWMRKKHEQIQRMHQGYRGPY